MGRRHHVLPLRQATPKLCFPTALLMLDQYSRQMSGFGNQLSELGNKFTSTTYIRELGMLNKEESINYAEKYGFEWVFIDSTPEAFERALHLHPFAYVGDLPLDRPYKHTLVIAGIEKVKGKFIVYFNDPWLGKARSEEFYKMLTDYVPFDSTSGQNMRIFYKP
jgi:hypothetical protein